MSEEKTENVRTVAAVSVSPEVTLGHAGSRRLAEMTVCLGRTTATLREIAKQAIRARDIMVGQSVGKPPDIGNLRAFESVEVILRLANSALRAYEKSNVTKVSGDQDLG